MAESAGINNFDIPVLERTSRGFQIFNFHDRYQLACSLQQSSLAEYEPPGTSAVWLGTDVDRMHLDRERVTWLVEQLQHWLDKGEFNP